MKKHEEPGFIEKLQNWKEIELDGSASFATSPGIHGIIICHVAGAPDQRILLVDHEANDGRITILNLDARLERRTWRYSNNVCAEELRFDVRQIALDGAEKLKATKP